MATINDGVSADESMNDIAIIGWSCRFPGGVKSPEEFWNFLMAGGDGIVPVPPDRWDNKAYYDQDREKKNRMYVNKGGFIENIDQFDPLFFGMSPAEASRVDPQHRWLLELTYEALENAGLRAKDLKGSDTAVYIGQFMHDYEQLQLDSSAHGLLNSHSATGPSTTLTANRISYLFDFRGPSVTVDTACSSALVALDLACKAVLSGDSQLGLAGGVNILLRPELTMSICKASMLSPDGHCKSFDAAANGYVRSEGAGLVLVKRLSDARRDGNSILAVIKATGVNQDGQTPGITVPSGEAQRKLLSRSLRQAGVSSATVQYVEAHGTGTAVGDPIEVNALGSVLGGESARPSPCIIGSVKSNIGHTEAAAGMAGLIKTVLAMRHGTIPKNIHYHQTNPAINLKALNLRVADLALPWPETYGEPRRAVVNSFGFGGTNANAILEEAHQPNRDRVLAARTKEDRIKLLPISSKSEEGLKGLAEKYLAYLTQNKHALDQGTLNLSDICYTAATKREHHKHRLVVSGSDEKEIREGLEAFLAKQPSARVATGVAASENLKRIGFVFSGMGTQWAGMGRELYNKEPVFRAEMDRCSRALERYAGWSLTEAIFAPENDKKVEDTYIAQPGIFAIQVALSALLKSWKIEPDCIVGHSAGEVGAAYVAGALSFEDSVKVIYHRSCLQQTTEGMGKMLAVGLDKTALMPYLIGQEEKISLAAINSEETLTLAGDEKALAELAALLDQKGIFTRFLSVGVPYHSPVMDRLKEPLIEALKDIVVGIPRIPLYSTVSGKITRPGDWTAPYWADNVREPVLFKRAFDAMAADGVQVFLEVAPHSALANSMTKNLAQAKANAVVATTLKRGQNDVIMLAQSLGALHAAGWELDWSSLYPSGGRLVSLPNYAWQHARYWCEADEVQHSRLKNVSNRNGVSETVHPLVGSKLNSVALIWQKMLDLEELSFLADHQVEGEVVYPAAGYIEMGLGIAKREYQKKAVTLEEIEFKRALFVHAEKPMLIETAVTRDKGEVTVSAVDLNTGLWNPFSRMVISDEAPRPPTLRPVLEELKLGLPSTLNKEAFYKHCHKLGLSYQAQFQAVEKAWFNENETIVELNLPESLAITSGDYLLHPVLLDGGFQGLFPLLSHGYLPVKIAALRYYEKPADHSYCRVQITSRTDTDITGQLTLFNPDGQICVEVLGVELKSTNTQKSLAGLAGSTLYHFEWQSRRYESLAANTADIAAGRWIIFADANGVGASLAREMERRGQAVHLIKQNDIKNGASEWMETRSIVSSEELVPRLTRFSAHCSGIVYLWALDSLKDEGLSADQVIRNCQTTTVIPMYLAQAIDKVEWRTPPHIYFISRSAHRIDGSDQASQPSQGALWGFGRVFSTEFPAYKFSMVDLASGLEEELVARLAHHALQGEYEQEIALRQEGYYVNRLRPLTETMLHDYIERKEVSGKNRPFRIVQKFKGGETDRLAAIGFTLPELKPSEVRIKVEYSALARSDLERVILSAKADDRLGSNDSRGYGCVGKVVDIGSAVDGLSLGDQVVAFVKQGWASEAQAEAKLVIKQPPGFSGEEAMTLATAFLPVHYALNHRAHLREGENILIHEAGDILSLAALQFAGLKRANIFGSARTPEMRSRLSEAGVLQVYDSSAQDFADQVIKATNGRGIDVVLSGGGGQLAVKTLPLLKPFGRFIEFGYKAGSPHRGLVEKILDKNVSYHPISLTELVAQKADLCGEILTELSNLCETGLLLPIEENTFCWENADAAAVELEQLGHSETISLRFQQSTSLVGRGLCDPVVNSERTYLITGGLGGLGLEMMNWLVDAGAKSIVLIGRSAPSNVASDKIAETRSRGVMIYPINADITNSDDVKRILNLIEREMLPLAGIIHAAGVLDDGVIAQLTVEKFERVLAPKIKGAWNLHQLTHHLPLDFFICFSSVAPIIGWAGQGNYAAANGFMDTLAHHRQALGMPALAVNWGPWSGSGMAGKLTARDLQRMKDFGMTALDPQIAVVALSQLLKYRVAQATVADQDWSLLLSRDPDPSRKSLFKDLIDSANSTGALNIIDQLKAATAEQRQRMLTETISGLLAEVLGFASAAGLDPEKSVVDYGVNSLMAMDLRNRLQGVLKTKLPATLVLKYPTVAAMVGCILDQGLDTDEAVLGEKLYWSPEKPDAMVDHEVNGPLAVLTPSVQNWIYEGHTTHFNVGVLLEIDANNFDLDALRHALKIAFTYHDGCRIQIFSDGAELKQEIVSLGGPVKIDHYDLRGLGYAAGAAKMEELNERLQRSFSFTRGSPLYRAAYYQLDDKNPDRFFLIFHHYISDAMSQKIIWKTITTTYEKVRDKQAVYLPAKTTTLVDWTRRLHDFAYGEAMDQLPYWMRLIEKSRSSFISDDFKSNRERRLDDYVVHWATLEREDYSRVVEFCREHKYEVPDVGTYALIKAFSRLTGSNSLWVDLITHARSGLFPEIEIPDLFGQISESASLLFELVPEGTHAEQIRAIRQQRLDVPHGGIGLRALRFINQSEKVRETLIKDESPQIGLNFDVTDYEAEAGKSWVRFARENSGAPQSPHLRKTADKLRLAFFVDIKARGGRLSVAIGYYKDRFYAETIAAVTDTFFSVLKDIAKKDPVQPYLKRLQAPSEAADALLEGVSE